MTIYADILVITNLYVDFFLLWCTGKFMHLHPKSFRLVLGALAGALCALAALIPYKPGWISLIIGGITALLTTGAAFMPVKPGLFIRIALCFWMFSLLLAGFFLFILHFFSPGNAAVLGNTLYLDISLPMLFFFTCGAYALFYLFHRLFPGQFGSGGKKLSSICGLTIAHGGREKKVYAMADTGNSLREPFSGLPVIVCQEQSVKELAPPAVLAFLDSSDTGAAGSQGGLRLVPFSSMGGHGVLPAFRPDSLKITKSGEQLDCYVAVCRQRLSSGQFEAIYNPDLLCPEPGAF